MTPQERDLLLKEVKEGISACHSAIEKLCSVELWLKRIVTSPEVKAQHGDKAILVTSSTLSLPTNVLSQTKKKGDPLEEFLHSMSAEKRQEMIDKLQREKVK